MKMKVLSSRRFFVTLSLFFTVLVTNAQNIGNYAFTHGFEEFTPLTDATVLHQSSTARLSGSNFNGINIGFDFWYMGNVFNHLAIAEPGFVALGQDLSGTLTENSLAHRSMINILAPLWDRLKIINGSTISYKLMQEGDKKVFAVEWDKMKFAHEADRIVSFQLKLYEHTGEIRFHYYNQDESIIDVADSLKYIGASIGISGPILKNASLATIGVLAISSVENSTVAIGSDNEFLKIPPANNKYYHFKAPDIGANLTNLSAIRIDHFEALLEWENSDGAIRHRIMRAKDGGEFSFLTDVFAKNFTDIPLEATSNYTYKIYPIREILSSPKTVVSNSCGSSYWASLKHHYKLNGKGKDRIGNNNGILVGSPKVVSNRYNYIHDAIDLNGADQFVYFENGYNAGNFPNEFTIAIRFKAKTNSKGGNLVSFGNKQQEKSTLLDRQIYMGYDGKIHFHVFQTLNGVGGYTISSINSYADNNWHSISATLSATGMKLYVDGVLVGSETQVTSGRNFDEGEKGWWKLGFDGFGNVEKPGVHPTDGARDDFYFEGVLDDFYIFDKELLAGNIENLHQLANEVGYHNIACVGERMSLFTPEILGATYRWSGVNGFKSNIQNPFFDMEVSKIGNYEVLVVQGTCATRRSMVLNPFVHYNQALWNGTLSSSLQEVGNWCFGTFPNASIDVIIPATGARNPPTLQNGLVNFKNVLVRDGGVFNITGGKLSVGGLVIEQTAKLNITSAGVLSVKNEIENDGELDLTDGSLMLEGNLRRDIGDNFFKNNSIKNMSLLQNSETNLLANLKLTGVLSVLDDALLSGTTATLTLASSKDKQAAVNPLSANALITTNVKVEKFLKGGDKNDYRSFRMFSSPIYDNSSAMLTTDLITQRTYAANQFIDNMLITGVGGEENYFDNSDLNRPSAWVYENGAYQPITSANQPIHIGKGLFAYYRGNRENSAGKFNPPYVDVENNVIDYIGKLNQQNVQIPLSYSGTGSYHLIGNPYAAQINWDNVTRENITGTIWMFNGVGKNYATYSDQISSNNGSNIIDIGQGFFVFANAENPKITFKESDKVTVSAEPEPVLDQSVNIANGNLSYMAPRDVVRVIARSLISQAQDETVIVFENGGDAKYTSKDAAHLAGEVVNLSSLSADANRLAINFMPKLNGNNSSIPLAINATSSGSYILMFDVSRFYTQYTISLKDNYTGSVATINPFFNYQFTIDLENNKTFGADRFSLMFEKIAVLPITVSNFRAVADDKEVKLFWQNIYVDKGQTYQIQKLIDGVAVKELGTVNANNRASYTIVDRAPINGLNYYKLFSLNTSGEQNELGVAAVNFAIGKGSSLYPNPFVDIFNIKLADNIIEDCEVQLTDMSGKLLLTKYASVKALTEGFEIDGNRLNDGLYVLKILLKSNKKEVYSALIVKRNK